MKKELSYSILMATVCVALLTTSAQAQFLWAERVATTTSLPTGGGPTIGLTLDSQANCYVTGWFDGTNNFGGVTLTNQSIGGSDIFVAKYNANGTLQWAQRAGGSAGETNTGRVIGVDTNGNVYVAGHVYGPAFFGSFNIPASSYQNFFLAKYNSAGAIQWVQQSVAGYEIRCKGLAVDGAGNSYALLYLLDDGPVTLGTTNVNNPSGYASSLVFVKYDNTGAVQWAQLLGAPSASSDTSGCAVAADTAGNVYVCGLFEASIMIGTTNLTGSATSWNIFIAKFNNSGALTWVQQPTGGNPRAGVGVAVDRAGNVYVAGQFTNTINFGGISVTNLSATNECGFVAKYSSSGVVQWANQASVTYSDVALDGQTNVYAAGLLNSNAAIAKYTPAGTLQWIYSANGAPASPFSSEAMKCAGDSAGHCYWAGWYQGMATFGTNVLQPQETWNFFLAEVGPLLFFDNFGEFTNGTDLTSTNYTPTSGPATASVVTSVQNGSPTITVTNFLGNTWALFNNSVVTNKNQYEGILSSVQTNQPLQVTWRMWIQATNTGPGMFLLSVPTDDPTANYNPPIFFTDTGAIVALTNGTSVQTPIGNWGSLAGTVMTNTLILDYPNGTFSYSLNGQTLATLPLGPYFTNVVGAIYFNGFERSAGSLGNRFAIADVMVGLQQAAGSPNLTITHVSPNSVVIAWPATSSYTLQSTTNLSSAVWSTVSPAPVIVNGQDTVTNPISCTQMFYRLSQ